MQKTLFVGLSILEPGESVYADNSAFVRQDRIELDRDIKIGVKTHRHTGIDGVADPLAAPSGVVGSGGSIPAGRSLGLGITFEDADGGETRLGPTVQVVTSGEISPPTNALQAVVEHGAGELDADNFTYAITYGDASGGETPVGPSVIAVVDPGHAFSRVSVEGLSTGLPVGTTWNLYRARAGGEYVFLASGTGAKFVDDGTTPAQCDVHPPSFNNNSTGGGNSIDVTLPVVGSGVSPQPTFINLYCSQANFREGCLVGQYPVGSGGGHVIISNLANLLNSEPPLVNRSFGGANKIDPDKELIDWHWKRPVGVEGELPTALEGSEPGDVRVVKSTGQLFVFNEAEEWELYNPAGEESPFELLKEEGMGVILFGEDLTTPRGTKFKQYTWVGKAGEERPENMDEFDFLVNLP